MLTNFGLKFRKYVWFLTLKDVDENLNFIIFEATAPSNYVVRAGWVLILIEIQWNFDLRKILGVTTIFLKSRFFLISNTRKPLKKHNFAK